MTYKDVINNNYHLLLSKKEKYTKEDINNIYINFFLSGKQMDYQKCRFIVLCTAIFHDAAYSKYIANYHSQKNELKRLLEV